MASNLVGKNLATAPGGETTTIRKLLLTVPRTGGVKASITWI